MKTLVKCTLILLLGIYSISCEFEPYEEGTQNELIQQESALYGYLQSVSEDPEAELLDIGCVEFIYPFTLFVYDTDSIFSRQEAVFDNKNFITLLDTLEEDFAISLSYPITGTLEDGESVTISSNEELEASLETCVNEQFEEIIGRCNAIVSDQECVWEVTDITFMESPSISSSFKLEDDGSVSFIVTETEYEGTWIFYFIGNELHLNINFEYTEENTPNMDNDLLPVKEDWNFDWLITHIDSEQIIFENETEQGYTLELKCGDTPEEDEN